MRALAQRFYSNPQYSKIIEWGKLITITGSAQILIQVLGLISGILIIRFLPTQEYALYTLANTMLGTMTVLSDGGISAGVMAQGGKVWMDKEKLGMVLVTGLELRRKFGIASLLVASPILIYLLLHHGANWIMVFLIIIALIPAFFAALSDSLLEIAPKLHQDISPLQKNGIAANIGRFILIGTTVFIFPSAFIALVGGGIPRIWANLRLKRISIGYVNWSQNSNLIIRDNILAFVKRILPGAIYYCVSGQVTVWIISLIGTTKSVAQLGALSRLSMILNLFNILFATLILPRFSRLPNEKKILLDHLIKILIGIISLNICIVGLAYLFPQQILWVLGQDYKDLKIELLLSIIGSCLGLVAGVCFGIFTCRGWSINPFISIPISLASILFGVIFIDVASIKGVLYLNIFIVSIQVLMNSLYCFLKVNSHN